MKLYSDRKEMLKDLAPAGSTVCEIGVFRGEFAQYILSLMKPGLLVCIDPFEGYLPSGDADGNNVQQAHLPSVYINLANAARKVQNLLLLRGYSQDLLPFFAPNTFDLIYIDGDHSYEGCKRDLQMSWKIVKSGGFVCGHDYQTNPLKTANRYNFGVDRAVDEFCREKGVELYAKAMDGQVSFAIRKP